MLIGVETPLRSYCLALVMVTSLETEVVTFQDLEEMPDSFQHQPFAVAAAFAAAVAAAFVVAAAAAVGDVDSFAIVVEVVAVATAAVVD